MINQARLRELLHYDPATGHFTWLVQPNGRVTLGSRAGTRSARRGCREIKVDGELYQAGRLAFLWMTGHWPTEMIDHANHDRDDNRWSNLREADRSHNAANQRRWRDKTWNLPKGVYSKGDRYYARIKVGQQSVHLGGFSTAEDAHLAYLHAADTFYGDFACAG